jgi:hypothetical protein
MILRPLRNICWYKPINISKTGCRRLVKTFVKVLKLQFNKLIGQKTLTVEISKTFGIKQISALLNLEISNL